ncbi:MAG: dihydrolipoyl dehydrogenase [Sedimentisphaerales bacterium]|nr:dihydrolipoyl dehydrogenase [Sedimentisphaerales bacterium]
MYDVAVLGAGPGGYVAALRAAMRGAKVCIIEEKYLGGTCLNVGCIPTKAMLHASNIFYQTRNAKEFGININVADTKVDEAAFMKRVGKVVKGLVGGVGFLLKKRGVEVINGRGNLTAKDTVCVETKDGTKEIKARSIIVATGSVPVRPGFLPWDNDRIMTTDEATTANSLPKSIIILGGGVIGCEFATVYSELGIETTVVEMLDSLAANLDTDICKAVENSLKKRNVNIMTGTKLVSVKPQKDNVTAKLEDGSELTSEKILVAIGRKPNIEGIGLEELGIKIVNGIVTVDCKCKTNIDNIYAIGDIAETMQYAHLASKMGIVAADNATGNDAADDRTVVPTGIYTHPEAASVGLSETQAKKKCPNVKTSRFPYTASGIAQAYGETEGMVKLMADPELGEILGAVVIGQHATDIIQEIAIAMKNELTVEEIANTIHPHPTFTEAIGEAAEAWEGLPLHSLLTNNST